MKRRRPKLYPVTHRDDMKRNRWCGPAALSAITGYTAEAMTAWIAKNRRGYRPGYVPRVRGVFQGEIETVLYRLGFRYRGSYYPREDRPTLARWLRERTAEQRACEAIVTVGNHFVVVAGNRFVDNRTTEPVFIRKAPGRRRLVKRVLWITQRPRRRKHDPLPPADL